MLRGRVFFFMVGVSGIGVGCESLWYRVCSMPPRISRILLALYNHAPVVVDSETLCWFFFGRKPSLISPNPQTLDPRP